jgi:hypothetical protein
LALKKTLNCNKYFIMAQGQKVKLISAHAKKTRKVGEKWTDAIKRSALELKKQNKI